MNGGYNFRQLSDAILRHSRATDWDVARREWSLVDVYDAEEDETCLCGHFPVREICVISNNTTEESTAVGNVCVKRFLGIRSDLIFKALGRIRKNLDKSLNADALVFFNGRGLFTPREYQFLQDTMNKRKLSEAQLKWRRALNQKVLNAVSRRGFQGFSN
jgi:hypothetical protein